MENLLFLEVSALWNLKVDGKDFWVWSGGVGLIGGGSGGGGGGVEDVVDESNAGVGDGGADFGRDATGSDSNGGSIGADFNTDSVGADLDVDNLGADSDVGADSDAGRAGVDPDAGCSGGGAGSGGEASLSDIISSIISRGGECTSTMLCCVLSFLFDWETLSLEEVLDLLLLLMVPLYALMSSVKQFYTINLNRINLGRWEIINRTSIWFIHG